MRALDLARNFSCRSFSLTLFLSHSFLCCFQVNISYPDLQEILFKLQSVDTVDIAIFEKTRAEVFSLMAHDSFRRYVRDRIRKKRTASRKKLVNVLDTFQQSQSEFDKRS
jgi:hypothetical protein